MGKKVVAYEERAESVSAIFDDGEKIKADILVGFDGIHSTVRNMMLQKEIEKEHLGMGAWRFYFELPDYKFEDSSLMYISGETQIGVVPLAERAGYVFVLQPCASDYWDEEDTRFNRVKEILLGFPGLDFITKHMSKDYPVILTNWNKSQCKSHGTKAASSLEETPPTSELRLLRKEEPWLLRMQSFSPKSSKQ